MAAQPSGTVTFLFTDLEGSTRLWQDHPDAMLAALAAHDGLLAGRLDAARADSERAVQLARRLGNQHNLANALNGRAWALRIDDPEGALVAVEEFLEIHRRSGAGRAGVPGAMALAAGLRARSGDDQGAFALLRDALVLCRDDGVLPQASAAIGWALNPLCHTGRLDVAAVLLGGVDRGALAHFDWPGTADARARTLTRIRDALGDEKTDRLVAYGAAMTHDELIAYAIEHLGEAGA